MAVNHKLKSELLSMAAEDQRVLQELSDSGELGVAEYHPRMKTLHQKNSARIREIINHHGWPGISLVGKQGSEAAWLIVQHAILDGGLMEECLTLLKAATAQGEAEGWCVAYLEDRLLTLSGKPQIYGTQHDIDKNGIAYPLPINDPAKVDMLRKELGLEPLAEATQRIQERHNTAIANRTSKA
ncbi:DUF6624 domain-containing protein [Sedimenticola selenatireducens]|uniref:DUF6624 domain-containing protein n=1 Tax=Sedimenticola selenatireducens TaxID=191960 RepID=UPI002AAAB84C|nr:DUF6624 domain-containing protein [Sedimenticola selenatireducens]